ncbi:hypothetical protein BDR22DRAFT_877515 [Usnea florida]
MGRIRLQICVLPWEHPGPSPSPSSNTPARQEPLKWCEPCTENTSMHEVCDCIYKTWKRMWKDSEGPLRIRYLKTAYGDFVDLEERVVGDLFDDRGADGNIRNSILEVHRYPPTPDELERVQRFSSFAPTSSARPRKRPLELPSQSYPSKDPRITYGEIRSVEEADAEIRGPFVPAIKRQCTRESRLNRAFDPHQPLGMREEQGGQLYHSSQISETQASIHQVPDSQKSPGKKELNPYDSPLGRDTTSENGAVGGAMSLDQDSTNSPELRGSIPQTSSHSFRSASQPAVIPLSAPNYKTERGIDVTQSDKKEADISMFPKRKSPKEDPAHAHNIRRKGDTPQNSDPIFDPIESDNESFHEKQQMQSAKRLKSRKAPDTSLTAPPTSNKAGACRRDGQFLVPSVPLPHLERARISLDQVSSQGRREEVHTPIRDATQVDRGLHADLKRDAKIVNASFEHAYPEACADDQDNKSRKTPRGNPVYRDVVDTTQTSSQATTTGSQESDHSPSGTSKSIIEQRNDIVSSQEREMNETNCLGLDDDLVAQEAERIAKDAEEQQEKRRIREKKLEEKSSKREAVEVEDLAKNKEVELKATKERLTAEQAAKEEKARAEQLAQVQTADAGEERFVGAKPNEKTMANAARLAEAKKSSEWMARERQNREAALAQKAKNFMVTADGAKQIELEKKEKELARLKALPGKKFSHESKADEQARGNKGKGREKNDVEEQRVQPSAQKLADMESIDVKLRTFKPKSPRQLAMAVMEEHQKRIPDEKLQKLRDSMEQRSRASTMSLTSSTTADAKRSMTPRIPGSSVLRSSPLSIQSSGNMEPPLRSALRQPSSALKRSVSSVSFDVPPQAKSSEYVTSTPNLKSPKDIDNEPAARSSSAKMFPKNASRSDANASSNTPMKTSIAKKAGLITKPTKTPAKNGKVQMKLNVTREVKKLKGPAAGRSITTTQVPKQTPKQAQKQEIVLSSGEDSSTPEEPRWQTGNAEAGPSSRKPLFPVTVSQGKKIREVKPPAAPIDPVIRNVGTAKCKTSVPATPPHSTPSSNTKSLQKSTPQSPASSLSDASFKGSCLGSRQASDSDLGSESEEEPQAPSPTTPVGPENGKLTPITMKAVRKAASTGVKDPNGHLQGKAPLQSIEASSSRHCSTRSIHDDGKHANQAADRQLQLESRLSLPSIRSEQASSIINGTAGNKSINQGLNHAGRLPNGIRPAYYKYPHFSELQKVTREATPKANIRSSDSSTQALPLGEAETEQSSSESDNKSDTDEDEDTSELPSQAGFKKSSHYPRIGKLIKLAAGLGSKTFC